MTGTELGPGDWDMNKIKALPSKSLHSSEERERKTAREEGKKREGVRERTTEGGRTIQYVTCALETKQGVERWEDTRRCFSSKF